MKKIIILILLISSFAYSQDFDLTANQTNGKFSLATNNTTFMGIASGNVVIPNFFDASGTIDTSTWGLMPNQTNGKYSIAYNKTTFMGKDSGTVIIPVYFGSNSSSSSVDTSLIPFLNQNNTFTGAINTFTGKMVVGTGTSNGTADFLAMGDTITLRGTVYRDSSIFRVMVNPFSQRLKVVVTGKTGNNMLTLDSTRITTDLALTLGGGISSGNSVTASNFIASSFGYQAASTAYFFWNGRSLMSSPSDGSILLSNSASNDFGRLLLGGTTSSFPSIKRSGTGLQVRLADDSGYSTIAFSTGTITALPTYADNSAATSGGLTAGQLYKTSTGNVMVVY